MSRPFRLILPLSIYEMMIAQAKSERPLECCGLLAGTIESDGTARVLRAHFLINAAASPVLFESDPRSMFDAIRKINRDGHEILAIYHSHPTSLPIPSKTDLERNYSEEVMNLIIGLTTDPPTVRAWWLTASSYQEGAFTLENDNA